MLIKLKKYAIISLLIFVSLYAEAKNKVKIDIFGNEESCWICLKGINIISDIELEKTELEITLYFCNESRELLNSLLRDYELVGKINTFLDPLCLYAKNHDFSDLPAIIIKDTKDSIVLKEKWGNKQKYIQVIRKIDKDFTIDVENNNLIEGLEFIKSLTLQDTLQNAIFNNRFSGFYNHNDNKYYGFIGRETVLRIFDSNGVTVDKIDINQDGVICFMPTSVKLGNDTNVIWSDNSVADGQRFYYSLNLKTKSINRKIKEMDVANCYLGNVFIQIPNTNKLVWPTWYYDNIFLYNDSKLLLMLNGNNNNVSNFGEIDSILSIRKISYFMWDFINLAADNNTNVYSLSPLSYKLKMYDSNGNYQKTINLEFADGFLEDPNALPEDIRSINMRDIYANYKKLNKLFVLDNNIFTVHNIVVPNNEELKFRDKRYWLTKFDKNGKRIGNTIPLPINFEPIYVKDNKILIQHLDSHTGKIFLHWYKIPDKK